MAMVMTTSGWYCGEECCGILAGICILTPRCVRDLVGLKRCGSHSPMSSILDKHPERPERARSTHGHTVTLVSWHHAQLATGAAQIIFMVLDLHHSLCLSASRQMPCIDKRENPHVFALELNANVCLCLTDEQ
jgi:hypothetical protein